MACPKSQEEDQPDVKEEQRKIKFARMQKKGRVLEERQMASHDGYMGHGTESGVWRTSYKERGALRGL